MSENDRLEGLRTPNRALEHAHFASTQKTSGKVKFKFASASLSSHFRSHKNNPSPSLLDEELPPSTRTPITRAPWARRLHDKQEPAINF